MMSYYKAMCYKGHRGSGRSSEIVFFFEAKDIYEAMEKAQQMPAVKHHKLPMNVKEITKEEYKLGRKVSAYYR